MAARVIRPRFVVEIGEVDQTDWARTGATEIVQWAFCRAFHSLKEADREGEQLAEKHEHVRVRDRGEA